MFSYLSPEDRVPTDHPLRRMRRLVDFALKSLSPVFDEMYSTLGRPSIAPEKLLKALLLQVLYTIRSERLLMEQLGYNLLFRWFVGLNMDESVWVPTVYSKNRDRLLAGDIAEKFFAEVLDQARAADLLSDEHFSVDGTLIEAWAGQKSFQRKGAGFREGCHAALIGREVYQSVQNWIAARRTGAAGRHGGRSGIVWIVLGVLSCGRCGRLMSTHAVRTGPVIRRYYRCRSTAGGREPCKGVMVAAHEIETAVLSQIGGRAHLLSKEQAAAVKERVRGIVYDAETGKVRIEIKPPDGSARDEAEATDQRAGTE